MRIFIAIAASIHIQVTLFKMQIVKIKSYLINTFPSSYWGYKIINAIYYLLRLKTNNQKFITEEFLKQEYFQVTAVLIVKNEEVYIKEWLEYHLAIGVEHFIIYDNESTDHLKNVLDPYIKQGIVSYSFVTGCKKQMPCYEDAIARFKQKSHWMLFLDADEFLHIHSQQSLADFLKPYEQHAGLSINWVMFDCNNHKDKPQNGFVISNYTRHLANPDLLIENRHIKTIVNPVYVHHFSNPHLPCLKLSSFFKKNKYIVDENFQKIAFPLTSTNNVNKIQINHYYSKSKEEYLNKLKIRRADNGQLRIPRKIDYDFEDFDTKHIKISEKILNHLHRTIKDTYQ